MSTQLQKIAWGGTVWVLLLASVAVAQDYTWTTNSPDTNTATIWNYSGGGGAVTIPSNIEGRVVTAVGEATFMNRTNVTDFEIPETVTRIGNTSFYGSGLKDVVIPDHVLLVEYRAFAYCPELERAELGNGISYLAGSLFQRCSNLTSVTVWAGVTNLGLRAFNDCSRLSEIYFAGDAPELKYNTFEGVTNAVVYHLPGAMGWSNTFGGQPTALWTSSELPYNWTMNTDGTVTITGYTGQGGDVEIPSHIEGRAVSVIGDRAFLLNTNLLCVTLPYSVIDIEYGAFGVCENLESVELGNSVTHIGESAFRDCVNLQSVSMGESVETIERGAFMDCRSLEQIVIPDSVMEMGAAIFSGCESLAAIAIGDGMTYLPHNLFVANTNLTRVVIGNGVTNIEDLTFWGCSALSSVSLGTNILNIGEGAFAGNGRLTALTIPGSVTNISMFAFEQCTNLSTVVIGGSMHTIGVGAFKDCTALTNIILPSSVELLRVTAFKNCENLLGVYCYGDAPSASDTVFSNAVNVVVYYRSNASGWGPTLADRPTAIWEPYPDFTWWKEAAEGVVIVDYHGTGGDVVIPSMIDGKPVTEIWYDSFYSCSNLITVTIPGSITRIQDVFDNCPRLSGLYFSGDAPELWGNIPYSDAVVIYHLPGVMGWSNTFGGQPTALWLPEVQAEGMGVQSQAFGFHIAWADGQTVVVEACTNLTDPVWMPLEPRTIVEGTASFSDSAWTNLPGRYYRLTEP